MTPKKHSIKELFTDPDGSWSHTKMWANIANATATGAIINVSYNGTLTEGLLGAYLLLVGAQRAASKYLDKDKTYINTTPEVTQDGNTEELNK